MSCVELVSSCLQQLERHEARVRAWVHVDAEGALEQARQLDHELSAGHIRGPLHGIPIGVKDIIDVAGLSTEAGSALRRGVLAERDAPPVARLRAGGAVILGKSVTTQFAFDDPPPTRNPWRLSRTPGGSSSGPAAAVAAGMCLGSLGTQTGGSLLRPASYCGVAAVKPTWGRVSLFGIVPLAFNLDHVGVIAGDCFGLAAMLDCVTAAAHADPFTADAPALRCVERIARLGDPPRIGVLTGFFREASDRSVLHIVDEALAACRAAGAVVADAGPLLDLDEVARWNRFLLAAQAAFAHRDTFPARRAEYGPRLTELLDEGLAAPLGEFPDVFAHRTAFARQVVDKLEGYDVLLTPTAPTTAPDASTTGHSVFNAPFSFCGLPALTLPAGVAGDGLPVGLQLVGRPWQEEALIGAAAWIEARLAFAGVPSFAAR